MYKFERAPLIASEVELLLGLPAGSIQLKVSNGHVEISQNPKVGRPKLPTLTVTQISNARKYLIDRGVI